MNEWESGLAAATEYARKHALAALLIERGGRDVLAEFGPKFDETAPHALYSGTKSFWGVAALYAQSDGILSLDEPVAETIPSWREDPWKRRVTLRMLLQLIAGFGFGGLGSSVPPYERALAMELRTEPGTAFAYGGIQLQVFGAAFARKLESQGLTPHEYLRERVLAPAGVEIAAWRVLRDGTQPLPTGASLSARAWLQYGRFVLRERVALAECFRGSAPNPRYGLGWWLGVSGAPPGLFYASGSGGQGLYVVPSLDLVAVHFSDASSYKHDAFLKKLLGTIAARPRA
ncbi:MAG TPA: serine hydrolase [Candidatus Acidoferrales bacterium]|nr:serine hydrolase [Candidatus Acidoferrales bacterium]